MSVSTKPNSLCNKLLLNGSLQHFFSYSINDCFLSIFFLKNISLHLNNIKFKKE